MSENTINDALRRMGYSNDEMTGQGVRTMASTLLNEQGWPADAIEKQLSHIEENKVRGAYNQAKYLPVRRRMMQFWADYLDELRKGNTASVKEFEAIAASHCGPRAIEQTLRTERMPPPMTKATLLPDNSLEFASCFRFSIELTGLSRATTYRYEGRGKFPARRQMGPNSVRWNSEEVVEWMKSRPPIVKRIDVGTGFGRPLYSKP